MAIINDKDLQAKSDQMNAVDLAQETTFRISSVDYNPTAREQNVWVHLEGIEGRPWKPSLGMKRVLCSFWSNDTDLWVGKLVTLHCENSVKWKSETVGGLRILAMSGIGDKPREYVNVISKHKRTIETVNPLKDDAPVKREFLLNHHIEKINAAKNNDEITEVINSVKAEFGGAARMQLKDSAVAARCKYREMTIDAVIHLREDNNE